MEITAKFTFERIEKDFVASISGTVKKHFGFLRVTDFACDIEHTEAERDAAEEKLIEIAHSYGSIREEEPDARRPY